MTYADDDYVKYKLSVTFQVLTELKHVLKEDDVLDLNVNKTTVLPKGDTPQSGFNTAHGIINTSPTLGHLSGDVALDSFCPEGFVGIVVPIGTDTFVQNFVAKTCRAIIDDVEKLDVIQDGLIHYQHSGFARTPVSNTLTVIFCSVIVAFCNSNTLIAKLLTLS